MTSPSVWHKGGKVLDSLNYALLGLRIVEVGASVITAFSLLAIAIHECTHPNGFIRRRRTARPRKGVW